jgi:hypothetical protein
MVRNLLSEVIKVGPPFDLIQTYAYDSSDVCFPCKKLRVDIEQWDVADITDRT